VGFSCGRLQQGYGRGVRLEVLALLNTKWKQHTNHLQVFGLHRLLVQHLSKADVDALVILYEAVVHRVGHVHEALRRWVVRLRQGINPYLVDQSVAIPLIFQRGAC
jgi:hypothetical protein